jgi:glycosyltransferase involved in cell wall biosynthesis
VQAPILINGRFLSQPQSGVQRFACEITAALLARDRNINVVVPPGTQLDGSISWDRVRAVGKRRGQAWEQLDLPQHIGGAVLLNLGNTAPLRARRQVVVIHDAGWAATPEAYTRAFRVWYRTLQMLLVRTSARLVTVSAFARAEIARTLRVDPARITVVPEGAEHITRLPPDPAVLEHAALARGRYVLAIGNIAAHKNLPALRELARALAGRGQMLAIAGASAAGVFRNGADLPQPARLLGRPDDPKLRALYEHAACLVFPSLYEGFGLPAVEAMACRCPVAAADIQGLRETCGEAATYFNPRSSASIAETVLALLDDPARAEAMREAGAARAAKFTWSRAADALAAVAANVAPVVSKAALELVA